MWDILFCTEPDLYLQRQVIQFVPEVGTILLAPNFPHLMFELTSIPVLTASESTEIVAISSLIIQMGVFFPHLPILMGEGATVPEWAALGNDPISASLSKRGITSVLYLVLAVGREFEEESERVSSVGSSNSRIE